MRITVGALKGGACKTTTAAFLAIGLARTGRRVLAVDADPDQAQLSKWRDMAGSAWPSNVTLEVAESRDFRRLEDLAADHDHLVFDVGPKNRLRLRRALEIAPTLVFPMEPSGMHLMEIAETFEVAREVDSDDHPVSANVLLVRTRGSRHRLSIDTRSALVAQGYPVLTAQTTNRDAYVTAVGTVPVDLLAYEDVLTELAADNDEGTAR